MLETYFLYIYIMGVKCVNVTKGLMVSKLIRTGEVGGEECGVGAGDCSLNYHVSGFCVLQGECVCVLFV